MTKIPVYFYIPANWWLEDMPISQVSPWSGFSRGCYAWTLQTYLYLKESGFPCQLVKEIPEEGIVISHRDFLDDEIKPKNNLLLTCLQADCGRHPYAQAHIVQNPLQTKKKYLRLSEKYLAPRKSFFVRHWPAFGLIPRQMERGNRLEHLAYFGRKVNLDSYFFSQDWINFLKSQDIKWTIADNPKYWSDYSEIDGIVAIRKFGYKKKLLKEYISKPATKLYNAKLAGVIPIFGFESSLKKEKSQFNYIEIADIKELKATIKHLKSSAQSRLNFLDKKIQEKDFKRMITKSWIDLIEFCLKNEYIKWCESTEIEKSYFLMARAFQKSIKYHLSK